MQKKKFWAGVVNGQIEFYSGNPQGNVTGLQGSRAFNLVGDGEIHDDNGNNAIQSTSADIGTDSASGNLSTNAGNNQQSNQSGGGQQTA